MCVCESQKEIYRISCPARAIYVGVPVPSTSAREKCLVRSSKGRPVRFLTLGIVCPRKNQAWAVHLFHRAFGCSPSDAHYSPSARLLLVGARYSRAYEIDYVAEVREAIGDDQRIELHGVTNDVDAFYARADVSLCVSKV